MINGDGYRYGFGGHENDNEVKGNGNHISFGDYGYDTRLGRRWNIDPVKKHHESSYAAFANSPIWIIDLTGRDSIIVHRSPVVTEGWNTNLYVVTFSYIQNGVETNLSTDIGDKFYMIGNKSQELRGDNGLKKEFYKLGINDKMSNHDGWDETIRVTSFGVFIHRGKNVSWIGGCKIVTTDVSIDGGTNDAESTLDASIQAPMAIKRLYNEYKSDLTGDKILLKTNSYAPGATNAQNNSSNQEEQTEELDTY